MLSSYRDQQIRLERRIMELRNRNTKLDKLHQCKDDFFRRVGHELRGPLATSFGYILKPVTIKEIEKTIRFATEDAM